MRIRFKQQIPGRPEGARYSGTTAQGVPVGGEFEGSAEELERLDRDFPGCFENAEPKVEDRRARPSKRRSKR